MTGLRILFILALVPLIAACDKNQINGELTAYSDKLPNWIQKSGHEKPSEKAKIAFRNGDYGNAEKYYRAAVEEDPKDASSWLGLAATYDRLKRFDNANRSYDIVIKLVGFTPTVLNNLGYHYLLRGETDNARKTLEAALKKDPGNKMIINNLNVLKKAKEGKGA